MIKRAMVLVMGCGALALGCSTEQDAGAPQEVAAVDETPEIIENLVAAGFPADDIMVVDGKVYVGRDAEVSLQASREMLQVDASRGAVPEQYRTSNLVSQNLAVICINGSAFANISKLSQGLDLAIENYNQRNLTFRMERRTTGNTAGCGATIQARVISGTGGSAGFPSGGLPFNTINIGSGLTQFSTDVVEHVITHELGHCIGFRHSDFFDRSISCGGAPTNEGSGGVGAIHIPGTPTGAVVGGSLMNSCFRSTENGEFTNSDITALNALY
ncbi:MAG TPA: zinc-dependent metalloprotease [Polyangiaceae bacterium]|nr:zinc-dependent metalloprotease [Polyangiaceae bacterium]